MRKHLWELFILQLFNNRPSSISLTLIKIILKMQFNYIQTRTPVKPNNKKNN